ncbi:helix-turn-helix domain-containing protein [Brevirhabdus sp.]|uniref:helix-turn-helix domain-containing protein n=1 Tax=Brevirhabdus sp. TaxID=2004514 RepID=UPI00405A0727
MSSEMRLDPGRGFVALPLDIMEIEMSPGAFRALVEFCRMANREGYCWPSLAQLGERLGRSKAAISGYIKELRALALLETQEQRAANGYNYRLKYRLTFWQTWREAFAQRGKSGESRPAPAAPPSECRVQQSERKKDKNHNHKNQSSPEPGSGSLIALKRQWEEAVGHAPYPAFQRTPDPQLAEQTSRLAQADGAADTVDPAAVIGRFFAERQIAVDRLGDQIRKAAAGLQGIPDAARLLADKLGRSWKPHWKFPPSERFLIDIIHQVVRENPDAALRRLLLTYLRRWRVSQERLPHAA